MGKEIAVRECREDVMSNASGRLLPAVDTIFAVRVTGGKQRSSAFTTRRPWCCGFLNLILRNYE